MQLPKITSRQQDILKLLYKYRFLNRVRIQALLNHKDYKRINVWLKDLRDNNYVDWIYSKDFTEKTKPGIYYLSLNGIRWLKAYKPQYSAELHKRYHESDRSSGFIQQCDVIAGVVISVTGQKQAEAPVKLVEYACETYPEYLELDSMFHFLSESELVRPALVFQKIEANSKKHIKTTFLVELIEATMPLYRVRKRLKNYAEFLEDGYWQDDTSKDEPNPILMFICPTLNDLIYCKRVTKRILEDKEDEDIRMWFTILPKLKSEGINGNIWEEVSAPKDTDIEETEDDEDEY